MAVRLKWLVNVPSIQIQFQFNRVQSSPIIAKQTVNLQRNILGHSCSIYMLSAIAGTISLEESAFIVI